MNDELSFEKITDAELDAMFCDGKRSAPFSFSSDKNIHRLRAVLSGKEKYSLEKEFLEDLFVYLSDFRTQYGKYDPNAVLKPFAPRTYARAMFCKTLLSAIYATGSAGKEFRVRHHPLAPLVSSLEGVGEHFSDVIEGAKFSQIGDKNLPLMFKVFDSLSLAAMNNVEHREALATAFFDALDGIYVQDVRNQRRVTIDAPNLNCLIAVTADKSLSEVTKAISEDFGIILRIKQGNPARPSNPNIACKKSDLTLGA